MKKFGDICKYDKQQDHFTNLPYVGLEDIESDTTKFLGTLSPTTVKSKTFRFDKSHVLYGRLRPYLNKVLVPNFEGHCSTEIFPVLPNNELDRNYLKYWFISDSTVRKIDSTSTGARMPRANMKEVKAFKIPIPPLPEQKRIVEILDEAFEAIDLARANVERNIQNAEELFQSKLNEVFTKGTNDWNEKKFGDLCKIGDGNYSSKYPKASEFVEDGSPFLTATNLKNGTIVDEKIRYISEEQHNRLTKGHISEGDLVIVVRGSSTGNNSIVPGKYDGANLNSQLAYLRTRKNLLDKFLFYGFNSKEVQDKVKQAISGAAQPQLPNNKLLDLSIKFPGINDQQRIISELEEIENLMNRISVVQAKKSKSLEELKKSILQKAFSGELTADEHVAA